MYCTLSSDPQLLLHSNRDPEDSIFHMAGPSRSLAEGDELSGLMVGGGQLIESIY